MGSNKYSLNEWEDRKKAGIQYYVGDFTVERQESTNNFLHVGKESKLPNTPRTQANVRFITNFSGTRAKMKNSKRYNCLI